MLNFPKNKIKVLIVDDSAFIRKALEMMVNEDPEMTVVGTAKNGKEGVEMAMELKPDVVTLDVEMPIMNGLEALEEIMKKSPRPVLMISSLTESGAEVTIKALELGAVDFIPKKINLSSTEIVKIKEDLISKIKNIVKDSLKKEVIPEKIAKKKELLINKISTVKKDILEKPSFVEKFIQKNFSYEILGIGSSTGGPMALQNVIPLLPGNFPLPVVIAQHMPPVFTKSLAKRLNELSAVEVVEAEEHMPLEKGVVYIGQGGKHLSIKRVLNRNIIHIIPKDDKYLYKPSVDLLFETITEVYKNKIIAVLLTGMGKDGAMGLLKIKNMGGYTIAQDEESSVIYGMPKAAADLGAARKVLPLKKISDEITHILSNEKL